MVTSRVIRAAMSTNPTPCVAAAPSGAVESTHAARDMGGWRRWLLKVAGKHLTRDVISTVVTSFVLFGLMTVQGVFLARMLGPEGRGQYATAVFYTQTLMYVGLLGTHHAAARWAARRQSDLAGLWRITFRLGLLTGVSTMAIVTLLALFALPTEKQSLAPLCMLCALFLPLEHIRLLWLSVDHGRGDFRRYNLSRLASGLAFPVLLGVAWVNGASSALIAGILFVAAPIAGLIYQRTSRPIVAESETARRGPTVKRLLQRGKPYALAVLVSDLCDRIDIFLFLWFTSFVAQGYYAASVPAANLLLVVPIALSLFAFNAGARRERKSTPRSVLKTAAAILGVQLLAAVAFAIVLEPLMVLVFGESFRGAVPLTLNLLPAYAVAGCGRIAEAYLQGRNKAILGVISRLVGAATMCMVVYFTFERWDELSIPRGAFAGYVVSSLMLLVAILLDVRTSSRPQGEITEGQLA